jgi:hypothetical protein
VFDARDFLECCYDFQKSSYFSLIIAHAGMYVNVEVRSKGIVAGAGVLA